MSADVAVVGCFLLIAQAGDSVETKRIADRFHAEYPSAFARWVARLGKVQFHLTQRAGDWKVEYDYALLNDSMCRIREHGVLCFGPLYSFSLTKPAASSTYSLSRAAPGTAGRELYYDEIRRPITLAYHSVSEIAAAKSFRVTSARSVVEPGQDWVEIGFFHDEPDRAEGSGTMVFSPRLDWGLVRVVYDIIPGRPDVGHKSKMTAEIEIAYQVEPEPFPRNATTWVYASGKPDRSKPTVVEYSDVRFEAPNESLFRPSHYGVSDAVIDFRPKPKRIDWTWYLVVGSALIIVFLAIPQFRRRVES